MKALELAAYVVNKCVNDPSLSITKGMRTKSWTPKRGDLWHIQSNKLLQH